jgi:hypothetical protein
MRRATTTAPFCQYMPLHSKDRSDTVGQVKVDIVGAILRHRTIVRQQQQRRSPSVTPYLLDQVKDRTGSRQELESKTDDMSAAVLANSVTLDESQ